MKVLSSQGLAVLWEVCFLTQSGGTSKLSLFWDCLFCIEAKRIIVQQFASCFNQPIIDQFRQLKKEKEWKGNQWWSAVMLIVKFWILVVRVVESGFNDRERVGSSLCDIKNKPTEEVGIGLNTLPHSTTIRQTPITVSVVLPLNNRLMSEFQRKQLLQVSLFHPFVSQLNHSH
jgi:hypothetical protein